MKGTPQKFPSNTACPVISTKNHCDVNLSEENFGNHGNIRAVYDTNSADQVRKFPLQLNWSNNIGLECYQDRLTNSFKSNFLFRNNIFDLDTRI